jgi:hypothetical protein
MTPQFPPCCKSRTDAIAKVRNVLYVTTVASNADRLPRHFLHGKLTSIIAVGSHPFTWRGAIVQRIAR